MCILDISKTHMFSTYYNYFKAKYGEKVKLCYTDTDSFILEIETEDAYKDKAGDVEEWFDTSNFPSSHPSGFPRGRNKKVIEKFKDEFGGKIMTEFAGLRAKMYAYKKLDGEEDKRCKRIKKKKSPNEDYSFFDLGMKVNLTKDVCEAMRKYRYIFGSVGEPIKEIDSLLDQLDDHLSDLGFGYNFPSAAEYKEAESTYQDYKRVVGELLAETPIEAPHFYETKFKNINYNDLDCGRFGIQVFKPGEEAREYGYNALCEFL